MKTATTLPRHTGTTLWVLGANTPIWVESGNIAYTANQVATGFHVYSAGTPSTITESVVKRDGFAVSGAEGNGLFVGRADGAGVQVNSASVGVQVDQAYTGLYVQEGTNNGRYTLSGTIGQPDAGYLSGDPFTLNGGFWNSQPISNAPSYAMYLPLVVR